MANSLEQNVRLLSLGGFPNQLLVFHQFAFIGTLIAVIFLSFRAKQLCHSIVVPNVDVHLANPKGHELQADSFLSSTSTSSPSTLLELDSMFDANEISVEEYVEKRRSLVYRRQ